MSHATFTARMLVITLTHLTVQFGERHDMPYKQTQSILDYVVRLVVEHLKSGDKVRLKAITADGFDVFVTADQNLR